MLPDVFENIGRQLAGQNHRLEALERQEKSLGWSLIESVLLAAPAAGFDFQNIPTGFRSLMLWGSLRSSVVATSENVRLRFNGDAGNNYNWLVGVFQHNSVFTTSVLRNTSSIIFGRSTGSHAASKADEFAPFQTLITDYLNVNKYQQIDSLSWTFTQDFDTRMIFYRGIGSWEDMSAINRVFVFPSTGPNFLADSILSLYGIR